MSCHQWAGYCVEFVLSQWIRGVAEHVWSGDWCEFCVLEATFRVHCGSALLPLLWGWKKKHSMPFFSSYTTCPIKGIIKPIVCRLWFEWTDELVSLLPFSPWFGFFSHRKKVQANQNASLKAIRERSHSSLVRCVWGQEWEQEKGTDKRPICPNIQRQKTMFLEPDSFSG